MAINNNQDLGLGEKVIQENRTRFVNKDGSFNVYRKGMFERGAFSVYHAILDSTWPRFIVGVLSYYILVNLLFAIIYLVCGRGAFPAIANLSSIHRFGQLIFYSIQIISTLGSSPLHPATTVADVLLAIESMVGLFGFALATSLMFARFSNPITKILFSENAVIAPYQDMTAFMVRIVNGRSNELTDVRAIVTVAVRDETGRRRFQQLALERDGVQVFPLSWTIVHPIDEQSPLYGKTQKDLNEGQAEFLIYITAVDQELSKTVYARTSYLDGEVVVGAKFVNLIERDEKGTVVVDPKRIGEIEKTIGNI